MFRLDLFPASTVNYLYVYEFTDQMKQKSENGKSTRLSLQSRAEVGLFPNPGEGPGSGSFAPTRPVKPEPLAHRDPNLGLSCRPPVVETLREVGDDHQIRRCEVLLFPRVGSDVEEFDLATQD